GVVRIGFNGLVEVGHGSFGIFLIQIKDAAHGKGFSIVGADGERLFQVLSRFIQFVIVHGSPRFAVFVTGLAWDFVLRYADRAARDAILRTVIGGQIDSDDADSRIGIDTLAGLRQPHSSHHRIRSGINSRKFKITVMTRIGGVDYLAVDVSKFYA